MKNIQEKHANLERELLETQFALREKDLYACGQKSYTKAEEIRKSSKKRKDKNKVLFISQPLNREFVFYTPTKSLRGYIFTAVCVCVYE